MDLKSLFSSIDDSAFLENLANVRRIPCGIAPFDVAMGGGLPQGRSMEMFGPESSGKSTIALHFARSVQKMGGYVVAIDGEYAYDDSRIAALKLDRDKTIVVHPDTLEDAYKVLTTMCTKIVESKETIPVVYLIDSITSFPTQGEKDSAGGMASQARVNSANLRMAVPLVSQSGGLLIGINQTRDNLGITFGNKTTTPGGKAWRFYSSIRVELKGIETLKGEDVNSFGYKKFADDQVGLVTEFRTVKNKTAAPHKRVYGVMFYETGYHSQLSMFATLQKLKLMISVGKTWTVKDLDLSFTKREAIPAIKENIVKLKDLLKERFFGDTEEYTVEENNDQADSTAEESVAAEGSSRPAKRRKIS